MWVSTPRFGTNEVTVTKTASPSYGGAFLIAQTPAKTSRHEHMEPMLLPHSSCPQHRLCAVRSDAGVSDHRLTGCVLLVCYTVVALLTLPFTVVLALYAPMYVGGQSRPDGPLVMFLTLVLLVLPLLLLIGPIGAWIAWMRRQLRPAMIFALAPVAYGLLILIALSVFAG